MLALEPLLKTRLQALPALTGWAVRAGTDLADRRMLPAVEIACDGADVNASLSVVKIDPRWVVTLMLRRGDNTADMLDAAFAAVLTSLHSFTPGQQAGRYWSVLALQQVQAPQFGDEGLAGIVMTFKTGTAYLTNRT